MIIKEILFNEYGFSDSKIKDLNKSNTFKVDDQGPHDIGDVFCQIFVDVIDATSFRLKLSNNAPINRKITRFINNNNGCINKNNLYSNLELTININSIDIIYDLSILINDAIKSKYTNSNWRWICPRTGNSLKKLYEILKKNVRLIII